MGGPAGGTEQARDAVRKGTVAGALLGALLLLVAEFTTLYTVYAQAVPQPIRTVTTAAHDPGLIPIALLSAILAWTVWRTPARPALLALTVLGALALILVLSHDIPDVGSIGLATHQGQLVGADASAGPGAYLETAGAAILLISATTGLLLVPGRGLIRKA